MSSELANELEDKIRLLEELRDDLANQIESLKELRERAASLGSPRPQKSHFLKVAEFLLSRNNRPSSAKALLKGAGISRSSLSQILHKSHKESFVSSSIPGFTRKKRWALTGEGAKEASAALKATFTPIGDLFDVVGELYGVKAVDCCARILNDHGNEPMNALAMAREAIQRGYRGYKVKGSEDEVLLTTAKSFWAALGRDQRFAEVRPLVFALKNQPPAN
jgi:hypothetical protein